MDSPVSLKHQDLTKRVIGIFFDVYNELGHGFLESVYQKSFGLALAQAGLRVCHKVDVPVWFRGNQVGNFEADVLVDECLLLELKGVSNLNSSHVAQLLNYLRATDIEVGILFNFDLKPEFKRLIFHNRRKRGRGKNESPQAIL